MGSVSQLSWREPDEAERVVDDALVVLEEPAEDQAGEDQRQRPGQEQAQPDRPLDPEGPVGQEGQAEPDRHGAGHRDEDVEQGVPRRFPEAGVTHGARVVREAHERRATPGLGEVLEPEARLHEAGDRIEDDGRQQQEGRGQHEHAEPALGALAGGEAGACRAAPGRQFKTSRPPPNPPSPTVGRPSACGRGEGGVGRPIPSDVLTGRWGRAGSSCRRAPRRRTSSRRGTRSCWCG